MDSQSGSDLDGDATTMPADAPETADPSAPMLFRMPLRAPAVSKSRAWRSRAGKADDSTPGTNSAVRTFNVNMMSGCRDDFVIL